MVLWVKCLTDKYKVLSSDSQHTHQLGTETAICNLREMLEVQCPSQDAKLPQKTIDDNT